MRISNDTLTLLLERNRLADRDQLLPISEEAARSGASLQDLVIKEQLVDEQTLTKLFADYAGFKYIEIIPEDIPTDALERLPERIARQYNAVVFRIDTDGTIHFAMDDPDDVQAVNFLEKELGSTAQLYIATRTNILNCLELYRGDVDKELDEVIDVQREDTSVQEVSEADVAEDSPIAQTVNLLLEYAIRSQASDIHIEPREEYVQVRYRIDGVLKDFKNVDEWKGGLIGCC